MNDDFSMFFFFFKIKKDKKDEYNQLDDESFELYNKFIGNNE